MNPTQYYTRRVNSIQTKNQFQKAVYEESRQWEHYLVDSVPDFREFVKARVERLHAQYPRCNPIFVHGAIEIHGEVFRIDISDFIYLHLHPVQGRWSAYDGFQLYIGKEGRVKS